MKQLLACTLALLTAWPALGQDDATERARIRDERAAAEARYAQEQQAGRGRAAVNDCQDKARRAHNATLSTLRRQERILDDAERQRRAAEHQKDIDQRNAAICSAGLESVDT